MFLATLLTAAAEEHQAPLIDVDGTVVVQFALFLIMFLVLSRFLFRPYLQMRDQRDKGIAGARHEAHDMEHRAAKMVADYDSKLTRAKQRGGEERARLRSEGAARERQLLGAARDEAGKVLDEARKNIGKQTDAARTTLNAEANVLAKQMAKKILGREVA
jgi:F-type H+-transporting ATPase subunit b